MSDVLGIDQKLLCRFGWHDWTKWVATDQEVTVTITHRCEPESVVDQLTYEIQRRECVCCGIQKMRRERR